jgi:hypothetical protein
MINALGRCKTFPRLAIPLLMQGAAAQLRKRMRSHRSGADGVLGTAECSNASIPDHPVRSIKGGFATSSLCRVHPSYVRRGVAHPIHSLAMTAATAYSSLPGQPPFHEGSSFTYMILMPNKGASVSACAGSTMAPAISSAASRRPSIVEPRRSAPLSFALLISTFRRLQRRKIQPRRSAP